MISLVRSLLAVVVGYVILTLGVGAFATFWFRDPSTEPGLRYFDLSIAVTFLCALVAGYIVVVLAPRRPLTHATVFAVLVIVMTFVAMFQNRGYEPNGWYEPAGLAAAIAGIFAGAWWRRCTKRPA
jgi:peptidoglycan/LPS O-acetylase OafA/YrhL